MMLDIVYGKTAPLETRPARNVANGLIISHVLPFSHPHRSAGPSYSNPSSVFNTCPPPDFWMTGVLSEMTLGQQRVLERRPP